MTSENTMTSLRIIVERAVRPVQAIQTRKKKMREELLAHVSEVFDEELAKSDDETVAVAKTAARFGDPQEVAGQLQNSVSRWQRPYVAMDQLLQPSGDTVLMEALRAARNFALLNSGVVALTLGLVVGWRTSELIAVFWALIAPLAITSATLAFGFVLLGTGLARCWFVPRSQRSRTRMTATLMASCVLVAAVPLVFGLFNGGLFEAAKLLRSSAAVMPVVPTLLYFVASKLHHELAYARTWSSLPIE